MINWPKIMSTERRRGRGQTSRWQGYGSRKWNLQPWRSQRHARSRETQDQDDELMALTSIYEPEVFQIYQGTYTGQFMAHVDLPETFIVRTVDDDGRSQEHEVQHLPPIVLRFTLPCDYPSTRQPYFQLLCKWLSVEQLKRLCRQLDEFWNEEKGAVVLFKWTVFLKEESLATLGITNVLDLSWINTRLSNHKVHNLESSASLCPEDGHPVASTEPKSDDVKPVSIIGTSPVGNATKQVQRTHFDRRVVQDVGSLATLIPEILEYNELRKEEKFNRTYFKCNVCLEERLGAQCIRFKGCEHVYCRDCMKLYFEVQIRDGNVKCLNCPSEKCVSQALPSQIRELVGVELFSKYDKMLLSLTLDSMTDIIYCPRMSCQSAIILEPGSTMASCPTCYFVLCIFCMMAYHGIEPCKIKSDERLALYEKYTNATGQEKSALEARFGKLKLQRLVETVLSDDWLVKNSKNCPQCRAQIEKLDGCNKMTCWKCNNYFCWLCMMKLNRANPYSHYDGKEDSECTGRLFQGTFDDEISDDDDDEEEILELYYEDEIGEFL